MRKERFFTDFMFVNLFLFCVHCSFFQMPYSPTILCIRLRCSAKLANSELVVGEDTNENIMWLLNDSDSNQELCARELFGFNTGSFAEVVTGMWGVSQNPGCVIKSFIPNTLTNFKPLYLI